MTVTKFVIRLQTFLGEVQAYSPKVDRLFEDGRVLVESAKLDKADIEGIDKTTTVFTKRWSAVDHHLKDRREKYGN